MDLADDCLAQLDVVVASVHSAFNQDESQMTDRMLRADRVPVRRHHRPSDRPASAEARALQGRRRPAHRRRRAAPAWRSRSTRQVDRLDLSRRARQGWRAIAA